jgi:hypothetical protein
VRIYAELRLGHVMKLERWTALECGDADGWIILKPDRDLLAHALASNPGQDLEIVLYPADAYEREVRRALERIDLELRTAPLELRAQLLIERRAVAERLEPRRRRTAIPPREL